MKTPKKSIAPKWARSPQLKFLALATLIAGPVLGGQAATEIDWKGPVGSFDYFTPAYWNGGAVPTNSAVLPDDEIGTNNIVVIGSSDPALPVYALKAGNAANASGQFIQNGSTITLQGGFIRLGVSAGSAGFYTLNGGSINYTAGEFNVGEIGLGSLNLNGGTIVGTGNFADGLGNTTITLANISTAFTDSVNQTGGSITITGAGQLFVGNAGIGVWNMSGGTNSVSNYIAFGRSGGSGTFNMTGGLLVQNGGGNLLVGTGFQSPTGGSSVGVLNQSGGIINCTGQFLVPEESPCLGTANLSGTAVLNVHDWIAVGRNSATGVLNITNSASITRDNNNDSTAEFSVGSGGTGTLNQNGGQITNLAASVYIGQTAAGTWNLNGGIASLGPVIMCASSSANGTLNLNGGLLQVQGITSTSLGYSALNFNGSTVQATAGNVNFISGITQASISAGGVVFDSQAYNITIPEAISDSGGGILTKIGSGTLTLTGANSYDGATLVNAGTLAVTSAGATTSSGITVAAGAAFSAQAASAGGQFSAPSVTFSSGAVTLDVDLNTFGTPSSAPLSVGTLTVDGTVTLNVLAEAPVGTGSVPLVQYSTMAGAGNFVLGSVPSGETGYLTNDGVSTISLVITSAGAPRWNGNLSGVWDIGTTANWIDLISGNPTTYHNGEPVLFDDTATGTTNVVLNTTVAPASITFNNSELSYTLTGSGVISGTTGLTKEGTNTLALLNNGGNSYTGPTVITAGTLIVTNLANGGSPSAIGAASANATNLVLAGGTLSYTGPSVAINRGYEIETNSVVEADDNLSLGGSVTTVPAAGFAKTGPAQLAYTGAGVNALAGTQGYDVLAGTVLFAGSGAGQTNAIAGVLEISNTNGTVAALNVSNATLNVQGSLEVGLAAGAGTMALSTGGVLNVTAGTVEVGIGGGIGSTGAVSQTGGSINTSDQIWIGQGADGSGSYTLSGGTVNVNDWVAVGRADATGSFSLSGTGVLNLYGGGGALDIGTSAGISGDTGSGVLTQTGGTISNNCPTWLGEGATGEPAQGIWNMSGGTAYLFGTTGDDAPASLYVGQSGIGTNTLNLGGTAAIYCANYVSLGHLSGVTGILNIGNSNQPGGTFTMTAGSDFNVGDGGAGILNMVAGGNGQLTIPGTLYLTRSSTASGTVNLNGGTLIASYVNNGYGFGNGSSGNPQSFNFNGGTLQANLGTANFIEPYVTAIVQSGGAIINDGGFTITIQAALGNGGGGLTKLGSGTMYLTGANSYTGTTLVSTGTLGNSGTLAGPVVVSAGATLAGDTGTIGTSTINNTLTLAAGSTTVMKITPSSNDEIEGLTGVNYGGTLVVTNTSGSPLTAGSVYQLIHAAAPGSGNFSSVTVLPGGTATFNPATGLLTIGATTPPTLNSPAISGGNLILTGSGGPANGSYDIITTTNLLTPLSGWTTNVSGVFSASGTFSNAIPVSTSQPMQFFRLAP
jgi:fibronectin-binding autotransporter adhesin